MAKLNVSINSWDDDDVEAPTKKTAKVNRSGRVVDNDAPSQRPDYDALWAENETAIETELTTVSFDNMDKDGILLEIQKVDRELLRINYRLAGMSKKKRHVFTGDRDALTLQLRALKQRSDMLFKCLDKVLPDKKEISGSINLNTTEADQIPDRILKKIVAGTITEEEYEHYKHLFEKSQLQEDEAEETRH